ncbi:MAG: hypothetical protein WCK76_10605, partial [Elusimicrobiota bacterium]
ASLAVELDGVPVDPGAVTVYASSAAVQLAGLTQAVHTLDASIPDKAGNLANAVQTTFTVDYTIPPAAAADLAAAAVSTAAVTLGWTAPGDDGVSGALYDSTFTIQYSTFAGVAWSTAAAQIIISTTGVNPGSAQQYMLAGLAANTSYYFRLWTKDDSGNYSAVSNGAEVLTLIESPTTVYIDEVGTTTILAYAYVPMPSFSGLETGLSGTNVSINGTYSQPWRNGNKWAAKAAAPAAGESFAAAFGGKVYLLGYGTNQEYDPVLNTWTSKTLMSTARSSFALAVSGGKIYAIGGFIGGTPQTNNERYDPAANTWESMAALPTGRYGLAAAAVNGKIYAIGGVSAGPAYSGKNEEYNPASNTWATKTVMFPPRSFFTAVEMGGKIYTIGGSAGFPLSTNKMYDPGSDSWTAKADMPTARNFQAAAAAGGKIYLIGGTPSSNALDQVEAYEPASNSWAVKAPMPTARIGLAAAAVNGRIYAIAGRTLEDLSANEEYDPGVMLKFPALSPNNQYTFKARARNASGVETGESSAVSTYTLAAVTVSTGPSFVNVAASSVTVNWSSGTAAGGYNGPGAVYRVQVSTASDLSSVSFSSMTSDSWLLVSGLSFNTAYYFRAQAYNSLGVTDYSWLALGSTITLAAAPSSVVFSGVSFSSAALNWAAGANPAWTTYQYAVSVSSAFASIAASGSGQGTAGVLNGLTEGTTYYGRVRAVNGAGVPSDYAYTAGTGITSVRTISAVPFTGIAAGALTMNWNTTFSPGTIYYTALTTSAELGSLVSSAATTDTSYSFSGLTPNTTYYGHVSTASGAGYLLTDIRMTLAAAPSAAAFAGISYSTAALNWQGGANPGWTTYQYEVSVSSAFAVLTSGGAGAGTTVLLAGLEEGTTYYGRVRALNNEGLATAYAYTAEAGITLLHLPPATAILQPQDNSYLTSLTQLSGTAADDIAVSSVVVSLTRLSDNYFWNGGDWTAERTWLDAELAASAWTYAGLPAWVTDSSYTVTAKALDDFGLWSVDYSTSLFTYDVTPPVSFVIMPASGQVPAFNYVSGIAADAGGIAQVQVSVRRKSDDNYWSGGEWVPSEIWNLAAGTATWVYTGINHSALLEGTTYVVMSKSYDLAGNVSDPDVNSSTFTYMGTPPTVEILQPGNGSAANSLPQISGAATDDVSVSSVVLTISRFTDGYFWNGADWQAGQTWLDAPVGGSTWAYTAVPAWVNDSSYTITAKARDNNVHWSVEYSTSVFNFDTVAPVLAVASPDGGIFNFTSTAALLSYSDAGGGGLDRASLAVMLDGVAISSGAITLYESSATAQLTSLTQGAHTLDAFIRDNAGNPANAAQTGFTLDLTAPAIVIVQPANGGSFNYTSTTVYVTYSDAGGAGLDLAALAVKLDGAAVDPGFISVYASSAAVQLSGLSPAAHTLDVAILDNVGNLGNAVQTGFTVDLVSPAVSIAQPPAGGIFNYTSTMAVINYTDAGGSGVDPATLVIKLDSVALSTAAFTRYASSATVQLAGLGQATHTLDASVQDKAGNLAAAVQTYFIVDLTSPTITLVQPAGGGFLNYTSTTVLVNYADIGGLGLSTSTLVVKLDSVALSTAAFTYYASSAAVQLTGLTQSVHALDASVRDKAGNLANAAQLAFTVDLTPPAIGIVQPANGGFLNNTSTTVVVSCSDTGGAGLSTSTLVIKLDSVALSTASVTYYVSSAAVQLTGLSAAAHTLDAYIQDKAGNLTNAAQAAFTVDLTSPTVALVQPVNGGFFNYTSTTVVVSYSDAGGAGVNASSLIIKLDSVVVATGAYTRYASSAAVQLTGLTPAAHTLDASIRDNAGNLAAAAQTGFTVDLASPTVSIVQPAGGGFQNYDSTMVVVSYSDTGGAGLSTSTLVIKLDSVALSTAAFTRYASSAAVQLTGLSQSAHTLDASIQDIAGNLANAAQTTFTVDFTLPAVTLVQPANGGFLNYTSTTVVVSYSDAGGVSTSALVIKLDSVALSTAAFTRYASSATVQLTGLSQAAHTLDASIQDKAGNLADAAQTTFTVDLTSPAVTLVQPAGGSFLNYASTTVVVNYSDTGGVSTSTLVIKLDSVALSTASFTRYASSATVQLSGLSQSAHTLDAAIQDKAGNLANAAQASFTVDLTSPTVTIIKPVNGSVFSYTSTTAVVNYSDSGGAGLDLAGLVVKLDGVAVASGAVTAFTSSAAVQLAGLTQGAHTLDASIQDKAGNPANAAQTGFTVNLAIPPAAVADLSAAAASTGAVTLSWTAPGDDGASGTLNNSTFTIQYSTFAGAAWSTAAAQINISTTGVNPGAGQHYTLSGLSVNTGYYFRLWTKDGSASYSALSNAAAAATLAAAPPTAAFGEVAYSSAALTWDGGINPAWTVYQYEVSVSTYTGVVASSGTGPGTTGWVTGLTEGTTYYGRVKAVNQDGVVTDYTYISGMAVTQVPAANELVPAAFTGVTADGITVNWGTGFSPGTRYYVGLTTVPYLGTVVSSASTTAVFYAFTGLFANTTYYGYISTASTTGFIQTGSGVTLAAEPSSAAFAGVFYSSAALSWQAAANPAW